MPNKYENYKDSNVPWIGIIPKHWEIIKGKHIFKIYGNSIDENNIYTTFKDEFRLIYYYKVDDMNSDKNSLIMSQKIEPKYTDVISPAIPKHSILIPKRGAAIATNKVKISLNKCYIDSNIMALYTNFNPKFYSYYLYARGLWDIADVSSVPQINNKHINFLEFVLPPIEEQKQIANYLDKKTAKIDTTIAKNKELIDLLEEKRVALINQVVTKGLNPDVTMKDSGIEWIGEIPENWATIKGKHIFRIYGNSINERDIEYEFNEDLKPIFFYKVDDMNLNKDSLYMSDEIENKYTSVILPSIPKNSILIPKRGAAIATNKVKITLNNCFIDSNIMALNTEYDSKFFAYFILGRGLWDIADVSSVPQINNKHINYLDFVLPPLNEQQAISKYLETELKKINLTIKKIEENISLLDEYKTSLIHHVVTGKIDVRGDEI